MSKKYEVRHQHTYNIIDSFDDFDKAKNFLDHISKEHFPEEFYIVDTITGECIYL